MAVASADAARGRSDERLDLGNHGGSSGFERSRI
jgi:hypothetical protein